MAGSISFFVISGFIMVWVTHGQPHRPVASLDFLFARITRIYPLWWAAAGAMTLYAIVISPLMVDVTGGIDREEQALSAGYLIRSFLLVPQQDYPVLAIGWTLIHELYFYAVFALLMLLPRAFLPFAMLIWGGLVTAASLAGLTSPVATDFLTLVLHPMTMEFIFGVAAGLVVTSGIAWRGGRHHPPGRALADGRLLPAGSAGCLRPAMGACADVRPALRAPDLRPGCTGHP